MKYFHFEILNIISLSMWWFNAPLLAHSDEHWTDILLDLFDSLKLFEDFAVKRIKTFYCDQRKTFQYRQCVVCFFLIFAFHANLRNFNFTVSSTGKKKDLIYIWRCRYVSYQYTNNLYRYRDRGRDRDMDMDIDIIRHRYRLDTDKMHVFRYRYSHIDIHIDIYTLEYLLGYTFLTQEQNLRMLRKHPRKQPQPPGRPPPAPAGWPGLLSRGRCSLVVCKPLHRLATLKHIGFTRTRQAPSYPWFSKQVWTQLERARAWTSIFEQTASEHHFNASPLIFDVFCPRPAGVVLAVAFGTGCAQVCRGACSMVFLLWVLLFF